jgi:heptosyltransferase III
VPCLGEGCDKHVESHSRCLDELPARRVIEVVDRALAEAARVPMAAVPARG